MAAEDDSEADDADGVVPDGAASCHPAAFPVCPGEDEAEDNYHIGTLRLVGLVELGVHLEE